MEQSLTNSVNLKFISIDDINYWAELHSNEKPITIPLLLTKEEAQKTLEKIKYLNFSNFPLNYIRMILAGCMMTIMRKLHS